MMTLELSGDDAFAPGGGSLGAQIQTIAAQLWAIAGSQRAPDTAPVAGEAGPDSYAQALIALVEHEYANRRARERVFDSDLFGEPAWDMLLYLYAARLRGNLVATSSLARASGVPATTALRWMSHLERVGLIERSALKRDGRIRVQKLTRRAIEQMETHFRARLAEMAAAGRLPLREGATAGSGPDETGGPDHAFRRNS